MLSAALGIPILPPTEPEAEQPVLMNLPLRKHQLRALHRCLLIEQADDLNNDFGERLYKYTSRGGCLADAVGVGKTATMIGLTLSSEEGNGGDTLVVAPKHLIPQWKEEIQKFTDSIEVIVGKHDFQRNCKKKAPPGKRRIVLVDVDTILKEERYWYDFRKVFLEKDGPRVNVSDQKMQLYRTAANYCVKSPKGGCSYDGYVYLGPLHLTKRPWRRVIFDEIQDLVADGKESSKNLLQLSRTATNVWLLSATPFPHGNASVYANLELLGFCRMHMNIETDRPLPRGHPFERIKAKLYIRSPQHVADEAVHSKSMVTRHTEIVESMDLEKRFYRLEEQKIDSSMKGNLFGAAFRALREMTVHPEASAELRQVMTAQSSSWGRGRGPSKKKKTRAVSRSVTGAAKTAVFSAKQQLRELRNPESFALEIQAVKTSLAFAKKVQIFRQDTPLLSNVFAGQVSPEKIQERKDKEKKLLHDCYCGCSTPLSTECYAERHIKFRIIREEGSFGPEFITGPGSLDRLCFYFDKDLNEQRQVPCGLGTMPAIEWYTMVTQRTLNLRRTELANLQTLRHELTTRISVLSNVPEESPETTDELARLHGSKTAALVRFLETTVIPTGEQAIVFSYWHDTLKLVERTLRKNGLECVFCEGHQMVRALEQFTAGVVPIILLSAQSKASGANLQCATHVILLDPAGSSAEHGSTLEEQAIGRAVRMGQEKPVQVTRFEVKDTLESSLFRDIDVALANKATKAKSDTHYKIEASRMTQVKQEVRLDSSVSAAAKAEENPDVQVTAAMTQDERLERKLLEAQEKGDVIEVLDDDDSEDDGGSGEDKENAVGVPPGASTSSPRTSNIDTVTTATVKIKVESISNKRKEDAVETAPEPSQTPKRARTSSQDTPEASVTAPHQSETEEVTETPNQRASRVTITPLTHQESMENSTTRAATPSDSSVSPIAQDGEKSSIGELLARFALTEYVDRFIESGYDNVSWLYSMAQNSEIMEVLAEQVGFKPGHAIRFQTRLTKEAMAASSTESTF